jgi:hypothetical protein
VLAALATLCASCQQFAGDTRSLTGSRSEPPGNGWRKTAKRGPNRSNGSSAGSAFSVALSVLSRQKIGCPLCPCTQQWPPLRPGKSGKNRKGIAVLAPVNLLARIGRCTRLLAPEGLAVGPDVLPDRNHKLFIRYAYTKSASLTESKLIV